MKNTLTQLLTDEAATLQMGEALAKAMPGGAVVFLLGELGAGKTTLMRGVLRGLGYQGKVKSPTYTLVEPYELPDRRLFHFDLYRLRVPSELDDFGMEEYIDGTSVCWIEWPEKGEGHLPPPDLICSLSYQGEGRLITLDPKTEKARTWIAAL